MNKIFLFSVKIEGVKYITHTETISLTNPFIENDVMLNVQRRLSEEGLILHNNSIQYVMKGGNLFAEGKASRKGNVSSSGIHVATPEQDNEE